MRGIQKIASCAVVLAALMAAAPAWAGVAGEIKNLTVIDHFFTTRLSGGANYLETKDASQSRFVILKFSGDIPYDNFRLYITDFSLKYLNNGKEDRNLCYAIASAPNGGPDDLDDFTIGTTSSITLSAGHHYFGIVCAIEQNITEVEVLRAGGPAVTRAIGSDHGLSVYLTTNLGAPALDRYLPVVRNAGMTVHTSTELVKDTTGVTIRYTAAAETAARELSQRIIASLNVTPTLQAMDLDSDHDIVIWIGH